MKEKQNRCQKEEKGEREKVKEKPKEAVKEVLSEEEKRESKRKWKKRKKREHTARVDSLLKLSLTLPALDDRNHVNNKTVINKLMF